MKLGGEKGGKDAVRTELRRLIGVLLESKRKSGMVTERSENAARE